MGDLELEGMPTYGTDAAGADTYVEVLAAPAGNRRYTSVRLWCATKDAIVSLDGGTTDHVFLVAGVPIQLEGVGPITGAIQAKNAVSGQNYATLYAMAW